MAERAYFPPISDAEYRELLEHFLGIAPDQPSHPTGEQSPLPAPTRRRIRRERTRATAEQHEAAAQEQHTQPETERGKWVGYVGRHTPQFDKLPSGRLRGQFWLGEHSDPHDLEQATWHRVYCLDRHAESLRTKALARGMLVEVAGTLQVSERQQADGSVKRLESIYCYGVRVLGNETTRAPR